MTPQGARLAAVLTALASLAVALSGCGKRTESAGRGEPIEGSARAVISLPKVDGLAGPTEKSGSSVHLTRGTEVQILSAQGDFWRVSLAKGGEVWVPSGSFERISDREARERRAKAVADFPVQPGRAVEPCPVLLAPEYGAARWGELDDGDDVSVVMPDHDFYGIRLADAGLAFVPARSVRLLPSPAAAMPSPSGKRDAIVPAITPLATPEPTAGPVTGVPAPAETPQASLPPGSEPPVLVVRVEPKYPETARRAKLTGDVTLAIVVEATGKVGKVEVVSGGPMGMTDAAVDAVKRWVFKPARVDGRPVATVKRVHIRFELTGSSENPPL